MLEYRRRVATNTHGRSVVAATMCVFAANRYGMQCVEHLPRNDGTYPGGSGGSGQRRRAYRERMLMASSGYAALDCPTTPVRKI